MKIINSGNSYKVHGDDLIIYDKLPAQVYTIETAPMMGVWLEKASDVAVSEKIYGPHKSKVSKVLNAFSMVNRNLGVILSGKKGIGKSICAKLMIEQAVEMGYPVILCNSYFHGIADFLTEINQEVVIVFDEFDKTFSNSNCNDDDNHRGNPQTEMLTLFDGMAQGKKLFVITCNDLNKLNEFLVNRPGRFHYHFRFEYPTANEIREYLTDKLEPQYCGEIDKVIEFASRVDINYDCLRAIAFELNFGLSFNEAIADLNIVNVEREEYNIIAVFDNNILFKEKEVRLDLFNERDVDFYIWNKDDVRLNISFNTNDAIYSPTAGTTIINGDQVDFSFEGDGMDDETIAAKYKNAKLLYIQLRRKLDKNIHYAV